MSTSHTNKEAKKILANYDQCYCYSNWRRN